MNLNFYTVTLNRLANKITGISTPILGVSWNPPKLEYDVGKELLVFLDDRRVLYDALKYEDHRYSLKSILKIRERLTSDLEKINLNSPLAKSIHALQKTCRRWLRQIEVLGEPPQWPQNRQAWLDAMQEFRWLFSIYVSEIVTNYKIEPETLAMLRLLPDPNKLDNEGIERLNKLLEEIR